MQPPVHFRGIVLGPSGFAGEGREWLAALEAAGLAPSLEGAALGPHRCALRSDQAELITRCAARPRQPGGITFHQMLVPHFEPDPLAACDVLSAPFETESLPAGWAARIERAARVIVRTEWNRESFTRGGVDAERLVVIPPPIDVAGFEPRPRPRRRPFRWLSVFDWTLRKGPDVLLAAFARAFGAGEAELVIKTHAKPGRDLQAEADALVARHATAAAPRVRVVTDTLDDLRALYADADGFVLASRGEGWGRPVHEAMLAELPVVVTGATALRTLVPDARVGYPVASRLVPVSAAAAAETPWFAGQLWHEPDREDLARRLREVVDGREAAAARARAGRAHVLALCAAPRIHELLRRALADAWSSACGVAPPGVDREY